MTETLFADRIVGFLYSDAREQAPALFRALTSRRTSRLLGMANFDVPFAFPLLGATNFLGRNGVDWEECVDPPKSFTTPRKIFERKIRYWERRPMPEAEGAVVSPATRAP